MFSNTPRFIYQTLLAAALSLAGVQAHASFIKSGDCDHDGRNNNCWPSQNNNSFTHSFHGSYNTKFDPKDDLREYLDKHKDITECDDCFITFKDDKDGSEFHVFNMSDFRHEKEGKSPKDFWPEHDFIKDVDIWCNKDDYQRVPEPETLALFAAGLLALGLRRWKAAK